MQAVMNYLSWGTAPVNAIPLTYIPLGIITLVGMGLFSSNRSR